MVNAKSDCSNYNSLPKLGFQIGDDVLNLMPDDYMDKSASDCSFSLMALDVPPPKGPLFIFGDPFLRRFVTIFDNGNEGGPRVGFAVSNQQGGNTAGLISKVGGGQGGQGGQAAGDGTHPNSVALRLESGDMTGAPQGDDDSTPTHSASDDVSPSPPPPAVPDADSQPAVSQDQPPAAAAMHMDDWSSAFSATDDVTTTQPPASTTPAASDSSTPTFSAPSDAVDTDSLSADINALHTVKDTPTPEVPTVPEHATTDADTKSIDIGDIFGSSDVATTTPMMAAETTAAAASVTAAPDDSPTARMRKMLQATMMLQQRKKGKQSKMISIKLHRDQ